LLGLRSGPTREFVRAGGIGLATAMIGIALAWSPLGTSLEERIGLGWLFTLRGPIEAPADVMVVGLDRRSAEGLELADKIRDWPRDIHADLIDRLVADQVPVITIDLIFERERESRGDAALAQAIEEAGRVVLFEAMDLERQPMGEAGHAPLGLLETQRISPPIQPLADAAAGLGPFPLPIVPARVSQAWLFNPGSGGRPTLPAVAVQLRAMAVYERWLTLLRRAGADGLSTLPRNTAALGDAGALRRMMITVRKNFRADKTLGERVRSAIDGANVDASGRRLLRALADLYDGPDSRYLNFYGPAGQIRTVSLIDVMAERRDPAAWQGHVAFVGQSEMHEPHDDAFITVYSRSDGVNIAGVEIAATTFANLLDDRFLSPSPYWLWAIAGFGLLIGMVAGLLPALWAVPACLLVGGLYLIGAEFAFARQALWMPTTVPLLAQLPLGLFAGLFVQYREARRAKDNLSKAIRYYLPEKIAEGFADAPVAPLMEDEEAYAYCLITDAGGFTRLAETMTSKQLKPFLEEYLAILFEAAESHGGRVTDSVGDGITAAWTSPTPNPAIAAKACQAALQIDRESQRFSDRHAPLCLPTRIGLNAGWVTLGHVGGAGRFTYTVVGDAVNTASRIEQLNKHLGTRILATRAVVEGAPDLAMRPLGKFQLFGKEEVLEIVEVLDALAPSHHSATKETKFAKALALFELKNWRLAADLFASIAIEYDDQAARLYLETCQLHANGPIQTAHANVIRLGSK